MLAILTFLKSSPLARKALEYAVVLTVAVAAFNYFHHDTPVVITKTTEKTVTVEVPKEVIKYRDVVKYVEDKANVDRLLRENAALKVKVAQLSETIAQHTANGAGTVTTVPTNTLPPVLQPSDSPQVTEYKDWRLHFVHDGKDARYTLTQKFEVLSTTGKNKDGVPTTLVKLFEIGPQGQRLPIPDTKTTTVVTTRGKQWFFSPTVQLGVGVTRSKDETTATSGVIALQWLKRGETKAAEDSTWSLLSPALLAGANGERTPALLPVSWNVGRVKYTPFKDLWVSPVVGFGTNGIGSIGVTTTASF